MVYNPFQEQKYNDEFQRTQTERMLAQAQIRNMDTQTGQIGANAASTRGLQGAQAQQASGSGAYSRSLAAAEPNLSGAQTFATAAGGANQAAQANSVGQEAWPQFNLSGIFGNRINPGASLQGNGFHAGTSEIAPAYKDGKNKIPGHGDGTVDTQPAMLAPGEAVLNKGAAEHLGRDTISLLNAIGNVKMGQAMKPITSAPAQEQNSPNSGDVNYSATTQGYAQGSPDVGSFNPINIQTGQGGTWQGGDAQNSVSNLRKSVGLGPGADRQPITQPVPLTPRYSRGTDNVQTDTEDNRAQMVNRGASGDTIKANVRGADPSGSNSYARGTSKVPAPKGPVEAPGFAKGTEKAKGGKEGAPGIKAKGEPKKAAHEPARKAGPPGGSPMMPSGDGNNVTINHDILKSLLQMHGHQVPQGGMPPPGAMPLAPLMAGQTPMQMGAGQTRMPIQGGGQ